MAVGRYGQPMAELLGRLRIALADRYRIERELGRGWMAVVHQPGDYVPDDTVAVGPYSQMAVRHRKRKGRGMQRTPALSWRSDSGYTAALRDRRVSLSSQRVNAAGACGRIRHMDALVWLCRARAGRPVWCCGRVAPCEALRPRYR